MPASLALHSPKSYPNRILLKIFRQLSDAVFLFCVVSGDGASGANQGLTQQVDSRIQSLERRASKGEKEQAALQKTVDKKLKDLIAEMNRAITQVNKNSSSASTSPSKTFSSDYPQKGFVHKVERGETVSSVAQKYKSKIKWIIDANQIGDPTKVGVGKELFVPQQ